MGRLQSKKTMSLIFLGVILLPFLNIYLIFLTPQNSEFSPNISVMGDIPEVDLSKLPEIDYESLRDEYYHPNIDMLIITPNNPSFVDAVKPLMEWKNEKGVKTIVLSNYSQYPGTDGPEKIRNMIKAYYNDHNIQWVLLAGDAQDDLLPIRYVYNPDVDRWTDNPKQYEALGSEYYKPTDFYYADLTGSWDDDDDGRWGEAPQDNTDGSDEIDWIPDVYVGRLPANDETQLEIMINKTLKYETDPIVGDWMGKMLLAGGLSEAGEDEADLAKYIINKYVRKEMDFTLLDDGINLTQTSFRNNFNNGYSTILFAGHGAPTMYIRNPSNNLAYESADASASTNFNMPSLIYADACSTSTYDWNDGSIGEELIKRTGSAGSIGVVAALRVTWYLKNDEYFEKLNRGNAKLFFEEFFKNKKFQPGKALYDSKVSYISSDYYQSGEGSLEYDFERKNVLTYCLLGDPEVDIYTDKPKDAQNPFNQDIYEGQLVEITIKNNLSQPIPYARVHLESADGKYFTRYTDKNGIIKFRLLPQANEFYNVTITGHNLVPSYFNFTALPDEKEPEIQKIRWDPEDPTISNNICFNVEAIDEYSGLENIFVLISKNQFKDYTYFTLKNKTTDYYKEEEFECAINKLDPGEYSFLIVARDFADNTKIAYKESYNISIPIPITDYILIVASLLTIGVTSISLVMTIKGNKNYSRMLERKGFLE
ncbi:MAG: C25 family cysteine peptidase [Promethearchaeota archaeon]